MAISWRRLREGDVEDGGDATFFGALAEHVGWVTEGE